MANETTFKFEPIESRPSQSKDEHPVWCDYLELLCVITPGRQLSRGEIIDAAFNEGRDLDLEEASEDSGDTMFFREKDFDDFPYESGDIVPSADSIGSSAALASDNVNRVVDDWYKHLAARSDMFGDMYPFELDIKKDLISLKNGTAVKPSHDLYLYLLLASNLKLFSRNLMSRITTDFEAICFNAQRYMFPLSLPKIGSDTHLFGKSSNTQSIFRGSLAEKFEQLSKLINSNKVDVSEMRANNSGDRGLDVISIVKFKDDSAFGMPLLLAQCACSYKDWKKKQNDHSSSRYRQHLLFDVEYLRAIYIPFLYRANSGKWFDSSEISTIVIDRLRIMNILGATAKNEFKLAKKWADLVLFDNEVDRALYCEYIIEDKQSA